MNTYFVNDITYFPKDKLTPDVIRELSSRFIQDGGDSAGFLRMMAPIFHMFYGSQLWVSKEVSDDLQAASITDYDFAGLEWPRHTLEIVFEDPQLPSLLTQRLSQDSMQDRMAELLQGTSGKNITVSIGDTPRDQMFTTILAECPDSSVASVTYPDAYMDELAVADELPNEEHVGNAIDYDMVEGEKREIQKMVILFYKLMLFTSSEGCAPTSTTALPTKKQGGKPGFKHRPKTDRFIVEYLPRHHTERKKQASEAGEGKHEFRGRRGHWRTYKAARYKKMQGKRQFIFPIPGPDGTVPRHNFKAVRRTS